MARLLLLADAVDVEFAPLWLVVFDVEAGFLGDDNGSEIVVEDDKAAARFEE